MNIPNGGAVLRDAADSIRLICEALIDGEAQNKEFFAVRGQAPDRCLAHNLVRYFAKQYLESKGSDVADLDEPCELTKLGNNGLQIETSKYVFRIRKAVRGQLPHAGSQVLADYYDQQMLQFPNVPPPDVLRLVVLWDVAEDYSLTSLALGLPRSNGTAMDPDVYWSVPIRFDHLKRQQPQPVPADELDDNELDLKMKDDPSDKEELEEKN